MLRSVVFCSMDLWTKCPTSTRKKRADLITFLLLDRSRFMLGRRRGMRRSRRRRRRRQRRWWWWGLVELPSSLDFTTQSVAETEGKDKQHKLCDPQANANPHEQVDMIFHPLHQSTVATLVPLT